MTEGSGCGATSATHCSSYNWIMERSASDILKEALALPPAARVVLADTLLDSLDSEIDEQAGQQWREEIRNRIVELDAGAVQAVGWAEVQTRLRQRIRQ